ncbi:serine/threonine-protein kinase par-1-like [Portunus trituberculatus]|nr:serine/threonine-protein kinase par-1-like [Portunus trituberculatus]
MMPEDMASSSGYGVALSPGQWSVNPDTGLMTLTEAAKARIINQDPIEKWYLLDPEPLARGQFAVVYHCRHRITGEEFAAKFSSRWRLGADCTSDILHEVGVCALLRQAQRTVQLKEVFRTETELVLVMEYAAGGDLQTLLDEDLVPYERDVISFTRQLLEGLVKVHDLNLVHLDIKPQNLVLMGEFPDCDVKLCDFEISRLLTPGREVREILGTPDYVAPEIILYEPITTKTDMWSLGVLVYVLLTGFLPFGGDTDQETFLEITIGELDFPEELFEDISAEAIDFIKKLLIRKPQSRMSARECLEHSWMKADLSKAKIPPQPLKPPTSLPLTSINTPLDATSILTSTSAPSATTRASSVHSPSLISALSDMITGNHDPHARSCASLSNTPVMLTPTNTTPAAVTPSSTTPTVLTPMSSSPRDIGLPPIHPLSGPKSSAVNSAYSSTNSLYRGGSRQSLDRARSLSKSREVLFERMQMSNQKKTLSKSRERLHEGRLGLSRSREDLWALRSFSHSEEALSVFSWLNQDDSIHKSCNNVFLPMLPMLDENRVSGRLYKSLASIDKIDEVGTETNEGSERQSIFDSRFSINDEEYNHLITKYNTAVNSHRGTAQGQKAGRTKSPVPERGRLKDTEYRGGRGASPCQKSCARHTCRSEPQNISKSNRCDRVKRDVKRRKGKKDKDKQRTESPGMKQPLTDSKTHKHSEKATDKAPAGCRAPSPNKRRGSVSHIEQRIQERHERQQEKEKLEKQERQEKQERRGSGRSGTSTPKRRDSDDKSASREKQRNTKNKSGEAATSTPRSSSPPKRNKVTKTRSTSSEASPSSSLESVKESSEWKRRNSKHSESRESPRPRKGSSGASSQTAEKGERKPDMDEAYVSLEEPVDDGIFSRSESMDSSNTLESDHTVRATDTSSDTLESTFSTTGILESLENASKEVLEKPVQIQLSEKHELEISKNKQVTESVVVEVRPAADCVAELSAIHEEEDEKVAFARSVSTSSDIGSMLSENSEAEKEEGSAAPSRTQQEPDQHLAALTWKRRGRSMSMQPSDPPPFSHLHLCRSNSFNLGMPLDNMVAAPWGEVCDGAISRALEMFKLNPNDLTTFGRSVLERRTSLQSQ